MSPNPKTTPRAVLITGAAGGVGVALTRELVERGYRVYAAARQADDPRLLDIPGVRRLALDVTDPESIAAAVHTVEAAEQGLAALINNAGIIVQGPVELLRFDELHTAFDVNVIGPAAVTSAFLPLLRRGNGRVVNISAATARVSVPFVGAVGASKAALESLSAAMRVELAPWKIPVVIVQPGAMETPIFSKAELRARASLEHTEPTRRAFYEPQLDAVAKAAAKMKLRPVANVVGPVIKALEARSPKPLYVSGSDAKMIARVAHLPTRMRDRLLAGSLGLTRIRPAGQPPRPANQRAVAPRA